MRRIAWALPALAVLLCACGAGPSAGPGAGQAAGQNAGQAAGQSAGQPDASTSAPHASTTDPAQASPSPQRTSHSDPPFQAVAGGGPGRYPPTGRGILNGKVILVDPGHNGGNFGAPSVINRLIWNGRETETCDTTGTETDSGYTEALFNWHVALDLTADLRAEGATVVLTRTSNTGVGPCVTKRAAIGNAAHANAAVSIHADGGPPAW